MQILLLTKLSFESFELLGERYASLLDYDPDHMQNILLTNYENLYINKLYIYARACLVMPSNEIRQDVLLSPSIVIDISEAGNCVLSESLAWHWLNTQQACYTLTLPSLPGSDKNQSSACMAYATSLIDPDFECIEHSIELSEDSPVEVSPESIRPLLEQAVNEYFANHQLYKMAGINPQVKTVRNLSPVFYIAFAVVKKYADYSIVIKSARSVHFSELASDFQALKIYLDALLDYRLKTYVSLVRFRGFIIALCQQHGVEFEPSYFRTFVLGKGGNIGLHRGFFAGVNDPKGNATIRDKHATNIFLQQMGVNVNRSREFMLSQLDDQDFINTLELDYPLVLKPTNKKMGYGVVTNILNAESMLSSVRSLKSLGDIEPVLVEEFFLGVTYRVLVIGTEVNAVLKFMPTYIIGNGVNTILELIRSKNRIIRSRIRINDALQLSIENDGYSWDTILPEGYKYTLSHNSHASMGGQATNVTNVFSTKYKKISLQVCSMLGLKHAGIDMNINETGEYRVLEVNSAPALSTHLLPKYGTSIDTYSSVFENLLNNTDVDRVDNRYLQELIKYHQ